MNTEKFYGKSEPQVRSHPIEDLPRPERCYKPLVHRTAFFAFLLVISLCGIGVLEYGCQTLPHIGWKLPGTIKDVVLEARQVSAISDPASTPTIPETVSSETSTYSPILYSTAPPSSYLDPTITTIPVVVPNPANPVPPGTSVAPSSSYLDPGITTLPRGQPSIVVPTAPSDSYLNPSVGTVGPGVNPPVVTASHDSYLDPVVVTKSTAAVTYPDTTVASEISVTITRSDGVIGTPVVTTIDGKLATITPGPKATTRYSLAVSVATGADGQLTTFTSSIPVATEASSTTNDYGKTGTSEQSSPPLHSDRPMAFFTDLRYFIGCYLAVLCAVILRILVGYIYAATKLLEPFYMLTRDQGALTKDFFSINYLSPNESMEPFAAMFSGHWLMLWTSVLYLVVGFISPFASELLRFYPSCESISDGQQVCGAAMWINDAIARILQGFLAFTCIMLINVWWMLRSHKSGVYSDPSSIASVASLIHHPEIVEEFYRLDQFAPKKETRKNLTGRRYHLGYYRTMDGTERYGIVPTGVIERDESEMAHASTQFINEPMPVVDPSDHEKKRSSSIFEIVRNTIFAVVTAGTLVLIVIYYKNSEDNGFERFMDSESFGPRFLITCVGIIIHSQWNRLERLFAVDEPFRRLYKGMASPNATILANRSLMSFSTFPTALSRGSFYLALVALVTILAEALIIVMPGIPFSRGSLLEGVVVSFFIAASILGLMLLTLVVVWVRPKGPPLPRKPYTLGAMGLYICASRVKDDLADLACMNTTTRDRVVTGMGREYGLRLERGWDGKERWTVDYDFGDARDPLLSD